MMPGFVEKKTPFIIQRDAHKRSESYRAGDSQTHRAYQVASPPPTGDATHIPVNQTLQAFPSPLSPLGSYMYMRIFVKQRGKNKQVTAKTHDAG
jgi:hypothetical protein